MTFRRLMHYLGLLVSVLAIGISLASGYIVSRAFTPATVEAQTYVRPSRGKPINAGTFSSSTSGSTAIYDFSAFAGITVLLLHEEDQECTKKPELTIQGWASAESYSAGDYGTYLGGFYAMDTGNIESISIPLTESYVAIGVSMRTAFPVETGVCNYTVYIIPEAVRPDPTPNANVIISGLVSLTTAGTRVVLGHEKTRHIVTIQNLGTVVVKCALLAGYQAAASTATNYPLYLAAGTASSNGTGSVLTLTDIPYGYNVWCATASGTADVGVTAY